MNFNRAQGPAIDDLYEKQSRALDPEERQEVLRDFEKRLLRRGIALPLRRFQWFRIVPHLAKMRGSTHHA